jgi:hypothetical protein
MALESNMKKTQIVRRVRATGPRRKTRLSPTKKSQPTDVQETVLPNNDKTPRRTSPRKLSVHNDKEVQEKKKSNTTKLTKPTRTSPRHKAITSDNEEDGQVSTRKLVISEEDNDSLSVSNDLQDASIQSDVDHIEKSDIAEAIQEIAFDSRDEEEDNQVISTDIEAPKDLIEDLNEEVNAKNNTEATAHDNAAESEMDQVSAKDIEATKDLIEDLSEEVNAHNNIEAAADDHASESEVDPPSNEDNATTTLSNVENDEELNRNNESLSKIMSMPTKTTEDWQELVKYIHNLSSFQDLTHLYMMPSDWIAFLTEKKLHDFELANDIAFVFDEVSTMPLHMFVEEDCPSWNPKSHGPRNFFQSFYLASLFWSTEETLSEHSEIRNSVAIGTRSSRLNETKQKEICDSPSVVSNADSSSVDRTSSFAPALMEVVTKLMKEDKRLNKKKNVPSMNVIPLKDVLDEELDRLSLFNLEQSIDREDYSLSHVFFEVGYAGHASNDASFIQREQAIALLRDAFETKDHDHIVQSLESNKSQILFVYFVYRSTDVNESSNNE